MREILTRDHIQVKVHPCAKKNQILGTKDGTIHVEVKAPPDHGKANEAVERLLAKESGKNARITKGFTRKRKSVRLG